MSHSKFTVRILRALSAAAALAAVHPVWGQSSNASVAAVARTVNVAPGPLAPALNRYAEQAGLILSFDPALTAGLQSPGLSGTVAPREAFAGLLAGTGLEAIARGEAGYTIRRASGAAASTLEPITVHGSGEQAWGPVDGYVARNSATATKTDTPLIETPQSISVITQAQMAAQGVSRVDEALRYSAGVSIWTA
jgi:iron complex outermembrane receptor protein